MKETIINSFNEYVEYTEKDKNRFLFRGQAKKEEKGSGLNNLLKEMGSGLERNGVRLEIFLF